jgi:hypothetical protein
MEESPDIKLWIAYIAAAASVLSVLINVLQARSNDRKRREHESRMAVQKEQHDKIIERLRSELAAQSKQIEARLSDQNAERNARRDYEYEARKRLYAEVEPVLFQLVELSEAALHRIYSLARTARLGNLSDPNTTWLRSDADYYYRSTLYTLLAPLAAVKLLQRRITFVDLSVEKSIAAEYALAKRLLITFTDDFDLARCRPELKYDPHAEALGTPEGKSLLRQSPAVYWKQGVVIGDVETCIECLLTEATEGRPARIKSFSEFDDGMDTQDSPMSKTMREVRYLFLRFHPVRRPVLWRILVAQACLYSTFGALREAKLAGRSSPAKPLKLISTTERTRLDWRSKSGEASDEEVLGTPFQTAAQYFEKIIPSLFDSAL